MHYFCTVCHVILCEFVFNLTVFACADGRYAEADGFPPTRICTAADGSHELHGTCRAAAEDEGCQPGQASRAATRLHWAVTTQHARGLHICAILEFSVLKRS